MVCSIEHGGKYGNFDCAYNKFLDGNHSKLHDRGYSVTAILIPYKGREIVAYKRSGSSPFNGSAEVGI